MRLEVPASRVTHHLCWTEKTIALTTTTLIITGGCEPADARALADLVAAERAVTDLLRALGKDPRSPHLADTPRRVAGAYAELLTPREFDLTAFPNDEHYDELVLARDIPVYSLCEHHLLPFRGVAHVAYPPG